ncbi:hypothetical protein F4553_000541 [Allocatelliglobosispora scoriae]|uniref:DUF3533 domain-containing protein n=1 Tax=Allocatelliglobosispora scoriae TaxID=643052 RepID=A0A841BK67_9ACTN|nr:DUF3533 domain-containing protein [Allocatelliglobosispora scoriae]MBB5867162.1 hypothetical protein [Allocatelliglobosispora scoriae]
MRAVRWITEGVTPRAAMLVAGVLALQLGFIASYLAAFHAPAPHHVEIAVAAPTPAAAEQAAARLNALPGDPVHATAVASEAVARARIDDRTAYGAVLVGTTGDQLVVASAAGAPVAEALIAVIGKVDQAAGRMLQVSDAKPLPPGDQRGLAGFYLIVGWVIGGYLVASALSVSLGARPATRQRATVRLTALAAYAVASGLGGAAITYGYVGGLPHHFLKLWALGTLVVFAVGAFTMALQVVSGIIGIGLAVLLFVILGNPSAGGAYPAPLLPAFWAAIGPWLPTGAGVSAFRGIIYFGGARIGLPLLVLAVYAIVGGAVTLYFAGHRPRLADEVDAL